MMTREYGKGYDEGYADGLKDAAQALAQPEQEPVAAAKKDAVFSASIEFIGTLTGMNPPPIEVAPPEILKPFKDFTEKVCSIFAAPQPAQQEPVRVAKVDDLERGGRVRALAMGLSLDAALYTTPPQRKPLTDEQIADIVIEMNGNEPTALFWRDLARAIEAAHNIKENT